VRVVESVENARKRLLAVENEMNKVIIGHEDFVKALMIATVAGEHIVVISPPGTAKSYAIHIFSKLLNAKFYSHLLTKFTPYDELFGSIDVVSLARDGVFKRNWSGIINADFIFLDEVFKANSAILNSLLSLLQERVVYDPMSGQAVPARLHSAVGASNEVPEDFELQAFYDRFAIKVFTQYLEEDKLFLRALEARWKNSNNIQPLASMEDVKILHSYAVKLMTAKIKNLDKYLYEVYYVNAIPLIKRLREKGVSVSDRTVIEKLPKLLTAYLALYGVSMENAMNAVFDLVVYIARTKEEVDIIKKTIDEALGEVAELSKKLEKANEEILAHNFNQARATLNEILSTDVNALALKAPWMKPRIEAIISIARQKLKSLDELEEYIRSGIQRITGENNE
jgi:MoxR-like ATPase